MYTWPIQQEISIAFIIGLCVTFYFYATIKDNIIFMLNGCVKEWWTVV